jgi:uncharacterized lipoprotein YajG
VVFLAAILAGCAEKGPILIAPSYQAPTENPGATAKVSVGVSPFRDSRAHAGSAIGTRVIPSGLVNDFVVQGTVAELATKALKNALTARGIAAKEVSAWDMTAEGMKADNVTLLLGGEIKTLWLESKASPFKTHVNASVQLKIVVGDGLEKKIVRTIEVNSTLDQDVLYSRERLENILSEALTSAIDQIFKDDELKKRLP